MARKVWIPVNDQNTGDVCTAFYTIRIRLTADGGWTSLPDQFGELVDSPAYYAIVLENLDDDVEYQVGVTRHCCEGTQSDEVFSTFTTTP